MNVKELALERINILISMAKKHPEYAKRYVYLIRKLSEKAGIPVPVEYKRWMCKGCNAYLVPGKNCTVRLKNKVRYVTCTECKEVKRFNYAAK
ncbi:Ribonuclease P protein component 4 [Candidatus Tiddalikarchaeum anstoanum]|nr:Ribonuclease P protein component 4 [Candidatus Tiddalikarchaeum anstoanum]